MRPQDHGEHQRRRRELGLAQEIPDDPEDATTIPTSNGALFTLYAPMMHMITTTTARKWYGNFSRRTHMPMSGRFRRQEHDVPDVHRGDDPPEQVGLLWSSRGPGRMPWIISATKIMAMEAFPGMPRVSSGMKELLAAALLADSGAATPSMAPWPNRSGCFETRFSTA